MEATVEQLKQNQRMYSWLRKIYPTLTDADKEEARQIFPEVLESEDERIRNDIMDAVENWLPYERVEEIRYYLEKQKEQKPAEEEILSKLSDYTPTNLSPYIEQKPAELSEEDQEIMDSLIKYHYDQGEISPKHNKWASFLKSLRPSKDCSSCAKHLEGYISGRCDAENKLLEQFGALVTAEDELRIKPRWKPSEEDEDKVDDICKLIEHATIIPRSGDDDTGIPPTRLNDKYKGELKAFVKSLRPQPHWKPSEEQMKWLKDVIETVPMTCRQQVPLESLYADLKKL